MQNIDYSDPFAVQQAQAQASLLRAQQEQQYQPKQGQMAGRVYVPTSPVEHMAGALRNIMGGQQERQAIQEMQGIGQQRQEAQGRDMSAFVQALRGTPENAPAPDYSGNAVGPTMPAKAGDPMAAYTQASQSTNPMMRQMGMQGTVNLAESMQKQQAARQEASRNQQIWQASGGDPMKAMSMGMDANSAKTFAGLGPDMTKDILVRDANGQLVPNAQLIEAKKSIQKAGAPTIINEGQKGLDNTLKLRGDFRSEPIYKANQEMQSAYAQIGAGLKTGTPVGDMAAATKIMKLLDPGSVVRESELGMAMAANGLGDRLQNYAQNVISGNKLTPKQRIEFQQLADSLYQESVNQYNSKRGEYEGIARANKLDVGHTVGKPLSVVRKPNLGGQDLFNQADAILNAGNPP